MRAQVEDPAGRRKNGQNIEMQGSLRRRGTAAAGVIAAAGVVALLGLTGCAKMDSALDKQWIVVDFSA